MSWRRSAWLPSVLPCAAIAIGCSTACNRPSPLEPGEYTSIAADVVLTFEYETPDFHLLAHRFAESDAFHVIVQSRDHNLRQCRSDDVFNSLVKRFESLHVDRRIGDAEREQIKKSRSFHRLRYSARPPLEAYEEVLSPTSSGHLMVENDGFAYELDLTMDVVAQLGRVCS